MGVQITFNFTQFQATYPEFAYLDGVQANTYFVMATMFHRNDGGGPIKDPNQQSMLLNMLVAHLVQLFAPTVTGAPANQTVGRVSNASQGSISAALDYGTVSQSEAWYVQTKYGAAYWAATRLYRTARWRSPRPYNPGPFLPA